jgi:hypothetical protein
MFCGRLGKGKNNLKVALLPYSVVQQYSAPPQPHRAKTNVIQNYLGIDIFIEVVAHL